MTKLRWNATQSQLNVNDKQPSSRPAHKRFCLQTDWRSVQPFCTTRPTHGRRYAATSAAAGHTHTHTHTQTPGRLVKLSLVSAGRVSTNHAAQCQRQHDACHLHTSTVYLLTYLLTNITRTQIYAQCDSDVSLFHIYASCFLPPSCRYNSEKCLSLWQSSDTLCW